MLLGRRRRAIAFETALTLVALAKGLFPTATAFSFTGGATRACSCGRVQGAIEKLPYPATRGKRVLAGDGTLVLEGKCLQKPADHCSSLSLCARWVYCCPSSTTCSCS